MKNLKIGLIGIGLRGRIGRHLHKPENGTEVIAGADTNLKTHEDIKEFVPDIALFTDYREMLKIPELDAVIIATPDYLHEEMAVASLEAGKAVYLEKPMAITLEGCDRILETAMRTGSKLFVGHNMRHKPLILKMKSIIDSGVIGELQAAWCRHFVGYGGDAYFRDWHSEQKYSTGLLLQKGSHDIDVMHWLMGGYTKQVTGMGQLSVYNRCKRRPPEVPGCAKWSDEQYPPLECEGFSPVINVEDHNMVLMQLDNGAQAAYLQCHYTPDAERNYTFIGTKGRIENMGDHGEAEIHVWTQRGKRTEPDIVYHIKPTTGGHGGGDPRIVQNFLNFVRFGTKTNTSPVAARNAVAAGVLAHAAMRTDGCLRDVPPVAPELIAYFENNQVK